MDDKQFKERASRLEKIAKVLEKLPAEVRNGAFDLLKGYVTEHPLGPGAHKEHAKTPPDGNGDTREQFFEKHDHKKPADNARLIAAYLYREYGSDPFTLDEIRKIADDVGITIPSRIDMTFLSAKAKGKKLFARAGHGKFKPTVHGEVDLRAAYSVKKGTKSRPETIE